MLIPAQALHVVLSLLINGFALAAAIYGQLFVLSYLRVALSDSPIDATRIQIFRHCLYLGLGISILISRHLL